MNKVKKMKIVVLIGIIIAIFYFANGWMSVEHISNLSVDAEKYGLKKEQLWYSNTQRVHNLLFTKSGVIMSNASEYSQIDGHDFFISFSNKKLNYFTSEDYDYITHVKNWRGNSLEIRYFNTTKDATNVNVVFYIATESAHVEGLIQDVYVNDSEQKLDAIDQSKLLPVDDTIEKLLTTYMQ